jgi:hypothetical protein
MKTNINTETLEGILKAYNYHKSTARHTEYNQRKFHTGKAKVWAEKYKAIKPWYALPIWAIWWK